MNITVKATLALVFVALSGCAPHLEGAYVDVTGMPAFKLSNGKYVAPRPRVQPLPYKVDGALVIVGNGSERATFAILPGGALKLERSGQVFTYAGK
jgi:hypothetical protein